MNNETRTRYIRSFSSLSSPERGKNLEITTPSGKKGEQIDKIGAGRTISSIIGMQGREESRAEEGPLAEGGQFHAGAKKREK